MPNCIFGAVLLHTSYCNCSIIRDVGRSPLVSIVCTRHLLIVKFILGTVSSCRHEMDMLNLKEHFLQEYFLFFLLYALTCVSWILNSSNCPGCIDSIHANKARWGFRVFGLHQGGTSSIGYQVTIVCPKIWKCRTASFD